jgi:2-polyprenyl-6-methoxyphenol hydroxylase-like FAD-dependent oxidoreductase
MSILVIGSGICGLGTALLLARDGHDVTLVERDSDPVPDSPQSAWKTWTRKGVAQFRQPHNFMPGLRLLLEADLPDLQTALQHAGASRLDFVNPMPRTLADRTPRPIDDKLWALTARRPVGEWVFAAAVRLERNITVRRGVHVSQLLSGTPVVPGIPHVTGVRTKEGEEIRAGLVVDAMGRQSPSAAWLSAIGARPPYEEQEDSGFTYYTRYFEGTMPVRMGPGLTALGTMSVLTLPGDNGTWSVTIFVAAGDQPLKQLRHDKTWTAVIRACPLHQHWLDGTPITGVLAMSGIVDRYRRFVVDGSPIATGFAAVADAWACTNPSAGRGLTVGFLHARELRNVLRATQDPREIAEEFHRRTEAEIAPWYRAQIAADRARFRDMEALRAGREPPKPADELTSQIRSLFTVMAADADLFRAALEYNGTITPVQTILRRPDVVERMEAARQALKDLPPPAMPGPNRKQLLDIVGST